MVFAESLEICSIPFNLNEENTSEGGNIMSSLLCIRLLRENVNVKELIADTQVYMIVLVVHERNAQRLYKSKKLSASACFAQSHIL